LSFFHISASIEIWQSDPLAVFRSADGFSALRAEPRLQIGIGAVQNPATR
jgi:hypothetical protein